MITLGVDDLERALAFYRDGLGFASEGIIGSEHEHGGTAVFELHNGLVLSIYERKNIAWDAGIDQTPASPTEFTLAHNVRSREEVDEVLQHVASAGATVTMPARDTFWGGYAGYFQDADGHLWEVAWNAHLMP